MPSMCGIERTKPNRMPEEVSMMLFGPGVLDDTKANKANGSKDSMMSPSVLCAEDACELVMIDIAAAQRHADPATLHALFHLQRRGKRRGAGAFGDVMGGDVIQAHRGGHFLIA